MQSMELFKFYRAIHFMCSVQKLGIAMPPHVVRPASVR